MIWGRKKFPNLILNFTGNPFRKKKFLCKASQNLSFPAEGSANFFSQRTASSFFFLESASQSLFFPGECLSKFIFSWRRSSEFFFLDFLRVHPQIINGRPLRVLGIFRLGQFFTKKKHKRDRN